MARSSFAGSTDYATQSFKDLIDDLKDWHSEVDQTHKFITHCLGKIPRDHKLSRSAQSYVTLVRKSLSFLQTCEIEIREILSDLRTNGVQSHHNSRLLALAVQADKQNVDYGKFWNAIGYHEDEVYSILEKTYAEGRQTMIDMIDIQNLAYRLTDFVGAGPRADVLLADDVPEKIEQQATELILEADANSSNTITIEKPICFTKSAAELNCKRGYFEHGVNFEEYRLSSLGKNYARTLQRKQQEKALEKAMFHILRDASENHGKIIWFQDKKRIQGHSGKLPENDEEIELYHEAACRMFYDLKWLEHTQDAWHRVTENGRKALENHENPTQLKEEKVMSAKVQRVFIVHGHDETALRDVEAFLRKLELSPIILFEEVSRSRTIIEKFENYSLEASFAIVLLTPDDVGAKNDGAGNLKLLPRARQNVVFELGYFFAKIGRQNVVALRKNDVEEPSDFHGIVYEIMDPHGAWKTRIAKEMKAAGLSVNMDNL